MRIDIKEIIDTLEINKEELKGNRMLTNEIIVDDIMSGLGYNKKRDKNVQRLYSGPIDWTAVTESGKKIAVKVFAYDEGMQENEELEQTLKTCVDRRFSVVMVTNGAMMDVFRYDKTKLTYNKVASIDFRSEENDELDKLLNAISKDGFDVDYLESIANKEITESEVKDILKNNKQSILEFLKSIITDENAYNKYVETIVESWFKDSTNNVSIDSERVGKLEAEIERYKNYVANLKLESEESENRNESDNANAEALEEINKLNNYINDLETKLNTQGAEYKKTITSLEEQVKQKESIIEELESQPKNVSTASAENDESTRAKLDSYVNQIRELSVKLSEAEEKRDEALREVKKLDDEIKGLDAYGVQNAERLLSVITDDEEEDRAYVAVINKELLQFEEIHTFIGRCIQKLYEIKGYEASQYIFDGDLFKLDTNIKYTDIVMGTKTYDVILASTDEDKELNKLRILFSKFEDIIFMCKKVGTLREPINARDLIKEEAPEIKLESDDYIEDAVASEDTDTEEIVYRITEDNNNIFSTEDVNYRESISSEDTFNTEDIISGGIDVSGNDTEENTDEDIFSNAEDIGNGQIEYGENQGFSFSGESQGDYAEQQEYNNQGFGSNQEFSFEGIDQEDQQQIQGFDEQQSDVDYSNMQKALLVSQLLEVDKLIWTDNNIVFNNIKYISTNTITFGINTNGGSYDVLLGKCIDAVLAIEASKGSLGLINTLKQKDFSKANNFIKLYNKEYDGYPRINGTKYVICGIESVQQVASTLLDVCSTLGISTDETFLYFEAETDSDYIIENFGFPEEQVRLSETNGYIQNSMETNRKTAIIRGDLFNNIVVTKNSLKVHKDILNVVSAVKTKYTEVKFDKENAYTEAVTGMILEANKNNIRLNYDAIGNVIGEQYRIVSDNRNVVSADASEIDLFGLKVYCSHVEDWQIVHSLLKIHTTLFNNTSVAIKTEVNVDAINFYGNEFETSEPSLSLAVKSFVDYVAKCIK